MPFGDRPGLLRSSAGLHCKLALALPAVVHHRRPFVRHRVRAVAHLLRVSFMLGSLGFLRFGAQAVGLGNLRVLFWRVRFDAFGARSGITISPMAITVPIVNLAIFFLMSVCLHPY